MASSKAVSGTSTYRTSTGKPATTKKKSGGGTGGRLPSGGYASSSVTQVYEGSKSEGATLIYGEPEYYTHIGGKGGGGTFTTPEGKTVTVEAKPEPSYKEVIEARQKELRESGGLDLTEKQLTELEAIKRQEQEKRQEPILETKTKPKLEGVTVKVSPKLWSTYGATLTYGEPEKFIITDYRLRVPFKLYEEPVELQVKRTAPDFTGKPFTRIQPWLLTPEPKKSVFQKAKETYLDIEEWVSERTTKKILPDYSKLRPTVDLALQLQTQAQATPFGFAGMIKDVKFTDAGVSFKVKQAPNPFQEWINKKIELERGYVEGFYTSIREQPVKTAITYTAFTFIPPALEKAGKLGKVFGVTKIIPSSIKKWTPKALTLGLGSLYVGSKGVEVYQAPSLRSKGIVLGKATSTELVPMVAGWKTGARYLTQEGRINALLKKLSQEKPPTIKGEQHFTKKEIEFKVKAPKKIINEGKIISERAKAYTTSTYKIETPEPTIITGRNLPGTKTKVSFVTIKGTQHSTLKRGKYFIRSTTTPKGITTSKLYKGDKLLRTWIKQTQPDITFSENLRMIKQKEVMSMEEYRRELIKSLKRAEGISLVKKGKFKPEGHTLTQIKQELEVYTKRVGLKTKASDFEIDLSTGKVYPKKLKLDIAKTKYQFSKYLTKPEPEIIKKEGGTITTKKPTKSIIDQTTKVKYDFTIDYNLWKQPSKAPKIATKIKIKPKTKLKIEWPWNKLSKIKIKFKLKKVKTPSIKPVDYKTWGEAQTLAKFKEGDIQAGKELITKYDPHGLSGDRYTQLIKGPDGIIHEVPRHIHLETAKITRPTTGLKPINIKYYAPTSAIITTKLNPILILPTLPKIKTELGLKSGLKLIPLSKLKLETKTETKQETKTEQKQEIKPELKLITLPKLKLETKTETKQEIKPELKQETKTETKLKQELKIKPKLKQELRPPKTIIMTTPSPFTTTTPPPPPPLIFKPIGKNIFQEGFNVLVKRKGEFKRVSPGALSKKEAVSMGASIVEHTAGATFKIEPAGIRPTARFFGKGPSLSQFYKKKGSYIEKTKYRISTPGELREITLKGLFTQKQKSPFKRRKKKRGFFGLKNIF